MTNWVRYWIKTRRFRMMLKTFIITTIISLSLATAVSTGAMFVSRTVVPETRPMGQVQVFQERPFNFNTTNTETTEDDYEDEEHELEYIWPAPERMTDDDRRDLFFTFLIIGLNEGRNANTIMVGSYDYFTGEANLISIPRDVPVNANRNARKLSSSYLAGAGGGRGRDGGVAQVQRDVMNVIGFIPDFYIVIDYDTFFTIIDAVDGIEIYVPFRFYYCDPWQDLHIDIPAGLQLMDSQTALHFARFRRANRGHRGIDDFQRVANQQAVINAVVARLLRPESLLRIPEYLRIFNESVHTNLTAGNMAWFAAQLHSARGTDALSTYTMPISHSSGRPRYYEFLNAQATLELINRTVNPFYIDIEMRDLDIISG